MIQIEFGEKLKTCREEKGMTQQTLADKLYVTRQAVSRWECGARYPDLVTAKRIAGELEISLDELVSGEKYVRDIEKEPVITAPVPLLIQTALYAVACVPFLLICLYKVISVIPRDTVSEAESIQMSAWLAEVMACDFAYLILMGIGLYYSVRNEISPRRVGWIMGIYLWTKEAVFWVSILHMIPMLSDGASLTWDSKLRVLFFLGAPFILLGFFNKKNYFHVRYVYAVVGVLVGFLFLSVYRTWESFWGISAGTDGIVLLINAIGELAYIMLLAFQTYTLNKKRASADAGDSFRDREAEG